MRQSRMMYLFFFKACVRRNRAFRIRPLLFEQAAPIQNLGRNQGGRFRSFRFLGSLSPTHVQNSRAARF